MTARLRACPYATEIAARATRRAYSVRIFAGTPADRWARAQQWRQLCGDGTATLLPWGTDPLELRWPGGSVLADVTDAPGDLVHNLAVALVRDGAEHAVLIDLADMSRTVHVKPAPRAQGAAA